MFLDPDNAPACQGYATIDWAMQSAEPSVAKEASISRLWQMLKRTSGILFLSGHSSDSESFAFYGEAFGSLADAVAALGEYQAGDDPLLRDGEGSAITLFADDPAARTFGIRIAPSFFSRWQGLGTTTHSMVFGNICSGASELGPAFIDGSDKTRILVGPGPACLVHGERNPSFKNEGFFTAQKFFRSMCGADDDGGIFTNRTVSEAVVIVNQMESLQYAIAPSLVVPGASQLRLFNAPRLVFADVAEDTSGNGSFSTTRTVYHWQFGNDYPYTTGQSYPGTPVIGGVVSQGPLRVILRFSEPMDSAALAGTKVELRLPNGAVQDVDGSWTGGGFPSGHSAIWTGTAELPAGTGGDGVVHVAVRAQKIQCAADLDSDTTALDLDGDGRSTPGTFDTSVTFSAEPSTFEV